MPQWQGGNVPDYYFGSQLLAWLAPAGDGPVVTVPVPEPEPGTVLEVEEGILGRAALLRQAQGAREAIEQYRPDRIVTLGGDCLVDLAPFAYLNWRYGGNLGILWVDAHPDVITPAHFTQGNAQVLGALLGHGDRDLVGEVDTPFKTSRVMYAGLDEWSPVEGEIIAELGLHRAGSADIAETSATVLDWIALEGIAQIAIHLDVDSMDPHFFKPVLFNKPDAPDGFLADVPRGHLTPQQVVRLLHDVAEVCDVVGLGITEFMPWEAITTRQLLQQLPLIGR